MPKMKTHKGVAKRVKITARGKLKYKKANSGHLMSGKNGSRRRRLNKRAILKCPPLTKRMVRAVQGG